MIRRGRHAGAWLVLGLVAVALSIVAAPPASGQPAGAVGKPLPDASMRDGTLMVRVIAGDRGKPVTGTDVTLTMTPASGSGTPVTQVARTDADGRASFADIPEAILVKLTVTGDDATVVASSQFPMPQTGGVRVLLSTIPMGDAGGAPMGSGPGPMTPRVMSGQPRPEAADARDTITVRVSYDDFADAAPLDGVPVALIGYRHDQTIAGQVVKTDAAGRAVFTGADARGATSYFAMTQLPRNGATDRLTSIPILLNGEAGVRVMLSAEKRGSTAPPVDDLGRLEDQPSKAPIPRGVVRVLLSGVPELTQAVELVDALTGAVVKTTPAERPLVDLDSAATTWAEPVAEPALATGTLAVVVMSGGKPMVGVAVGAHRTDGVADLDTYTRLTDATGTAMLTGLPAGAAVDLSLVADLDVVFKRTVTVPVQGGARVTAEATWQTRGEGGCRFLDVPGGVDRVYAVRTTMLRGQRFLSPPFQLTPERGVSITVLVYPRVMFSFSLTSWIDDVFVGVRGQFAIRNTSWAPYVASTDGRPDELTMPLPAGFTGAMVRDEFQDMVGVDPSRGFIIRRPIPPGGYQFIAGFSLKVDDGEVHWSMPLPLGAFESGIEIKRASTELRVELPSVRGPEVEEVEDQRGRFYVISPITIMPGESMVFTLHDLPRAPMWRRWSKVIVGALVLAMLVLGAVFALWRPRTGAVPEARFEALLDELAGLEASGAEPARRAALMTELEGLYRQGPQGRSPDEPGRG